MDISVYKTEYGCKVRHCQAFDDPIIFVLVLSPEGAVLVLVLEKVKIFDNVKLDVYRVSMTFVAWAYRLCNRVRVRVRVCRQPTAIDDA